MKRNQLVSLVVLAAMMLGVFQPVVAQPVQKTAPMSAAQTVNNIALIYPVRNTGYQWRITQGYNTYYHGGNDDNPADLMTFDIAESGRSSEGQEVIAAAAGEVWYVNAEKCQIVLRHNNLYTSYLHVLPVEGLRNEQVVEVGQSIGTIQLCGGITEGAHVHFMLNHWTGTGTPPRTLPFRSDWEALPFLNICGDSYPYNGVANEHKGTDITPCATSAPTVCISPDTTFCDVPPNAWGYEAIEAMYAAGYVSGVVDAEGRRWFYPENLLSRELMALILIRRVHRDGNYVPTGPYKGYFADVPENHPRALYVEELYERGITGGANYCRPAGSNPDDLYFCPDAPVSRGQVAVFLARTEGWNLRPAQNIFTDMREDNIFTQAAEYMYLQGYTSGCNQAPFSYCPDMHTPRNMVMILLARSFGFVIAVPRLQDVNHNLIPDDLESYFGIPCETDLNHNASSVLATSISLPVSTSTSSDQDRDGLRDGLELVAGTDICGVEPELGHFQRFFISELMRKVDRKDLKKLVTDYAISRPQGGERIKEIGSRLKQYFTDLGYKVKYVPIGTRSLEMELRIYGPFQPGHEPKSIYIIAHYDSRIDSPGANDNMSGVAAIMTIAKILKENYVLQQYNVVFVLFDRHEYGRISPEYVKAINQDNVAAVINLDMIGMAARETNRINLRCVTGKGENESQKQVNEVVFIAMRQVARSFYDDRNMFGNSLSLMVYPDISEKSCTLSDQESFYNAGLPGVQLRDNLNTEREYRYIYTDRENSQSSIRKGIANGTIYHGPYDTWENTIARHFDGGSADYYERVIKLLIGTIVNLDWGDSLSSVVRTPQRETNVVQQSDPFGVGSPVTFTVQAIDEDNNGLIDRLRFSTMLTSTGISDCRVFHKLC